MFGNVTNQVSGLGSSLGSWFKKEKEGEESVEGNGSKEGATSPQNQPDQPSPASANISVKSVKGSADGNEDAVSNHSGATEGADSNPASDHEDEAAAAAAAADKAGFASGLANFNLSGVSSRASASAKTVGSFFGTAFSKASASVKEAGTKIKETVEKNPLLSEFNKEQEAFIAAKGGKPGEACAPWVGYPEEDKLKEEIMGLATERKNFVRNPPTGVIFEFDLDQFLPVAQATLAADPELEKMRFELVPKVVSEEVFWRNYFYRVGLIRQSTELSSLETDGGPDSASAKEAQDNKARSAATAPPSGAPEVSTSNPTTTAAASATSAAIEEATSDSVIVAAAATAVGGDGGGGAQAEIEFVSESFQPSSQDVEAIKRDVSSITNTAG